jgi:hypothetical protein
MIRDTSEPSAPASMAECPRNCEGHYVHDVQLGGVAVVIIIRERAELCETRCETVGRAAPPQRCVDPSICGRELRSM